MGNAAPVLSELSSTSKIGVVLYMLVASWIAGCALRLQHRRAWDQSWQLWLGIGFSMVALAVWRGSMAEPRLLFWLRSLAQGRGSYEARQEIQAPLAAVGLIVLGAILLLTLRRTNVTPRSLAIVAVVLLLALAGIRLISLHATDALLYKPLGPLNINQMIEAILLMTITIAAWADLRAASRVAGPACQRR